MKILILILFILTFTSCAKQAGKTKGTFKLKLGNVIGIPMNGGAFVETMNLSTNKAEIIKLDADSSAMIPNGTYNLMFITFTGPGLYGGTQYCGGVMNTPLLTPSASLNVTISQPPCSQANFIALKSRIMGTTNSNWDSALYDQGTWAP